MEDVKNSYLNEQGLRQERDTLRIENDRLRGALEFARADIIQTMETFGDDDPSTDATIVAIDAALEMSGGVKCILKGNGEGQ